MRPITKTTALMLLGIITITPMAALLAQPTPPAAAEQGPPDRPPPPRRPFMSGPPGEVMHGDPMMGGRPDAGPRHPHFDPSLFSLMYRPDDRKLTPPDVQKIAEAVLLWFGNRSWKVVEVAPGSDGTISFAYATHEGSVIARFAMNTRTGRVTRTG